MYISVKQTRCLSGRELSPEANDLIPVWDEIYD